METNDILKKLIETKGFIGHKVGKNLGIRGLHPSMIPFLLGNRKNIALISPHALVKNVIKSLYILFSIMKRDGHILIVNTNPELIHVVDNFALKTKNFENYFSYCNGKWIGGTLTNWNHMSTSIATFISFSKRFGKFILQNNIYLPRYRKFKKGFRGFAFSKKKDCLSKLPNNRSSQRMANRFSAWYNTKQGVTSLSGDLVNERSGQTAQAKGNHSDRIHQFSGITYPRGDCTPKEIVGSVCTVYKQRSHEARKMTKNLVHKGKKRGFLKNEGCQFDEGKRVVRKPDIVVVLNPNENRNVLQEAKNLNIPVIALTDTNTSLSFIAYPVPVNCNSPFFVHYYFSWLARVLQFMSKKKGM